MIQNIVNTTLKNFCKCGCGTEIPFRDKWRSKRFWVKGHRNRGENSPSWKGGKKITSRGYKMILFKSHPRSKSHGGYVQEHVLVMENHIGRYLTKDEIVHHIDENPLNNDLSNLLLLPNQSVHLSIHRLGKHADTGNRSCFECGSKTTTSRKPYGHNKTPYPNWYHLPYDKENWYCTKCRYRLFREHKLKRDE